MVGSACTGFGCSTRSDSCGKEELLVSASSPSSSATRNSSFEFCFCSSWTSRLSTEGFVGASVVDACERFDITPETRTDELPPTLMRGTFVSDLRLKRSHAQAKVFGQIMNPRSEVENIKPKTTFIKYDASRLTPSGRKEWERSTAHEFMS